MNPDTNQLIEECFRKARITGELSDSSISKYRDSAKKFFSIVAKDIEELSPADFDSFIIKMKDNGASNARIANVISAIKRILRDLRNECLIKNQIDLDKIRKPKIERKEVCYLTEDEIKILLETIKNDIQRSKAIRKVRMMLLIVLLLQTGARLGEALSIKIKDIDRINYEIPIIGKGKKPRSLYLSDDTLYWINEYLKVRKSSHEYLFVTLTGDSRWQQTDVGRSFRNYRKRCGINKHFVLHTMRHTTATQLTLKGVAMNSIQHILGHTRLETTIRYYIGAVEKSMAKKVMRDEYYRFIPKEAII